MDRLETMTSFVEVAKQGSFSTAANQLRLSRALVSRHIQDLEEHLGARLLNRTTRSVTLTEAGNRYFEGVMAVALAAPRDRRWPILSGVLIASDIGGALDVFANSIVARAVHLIGSPQLMELYAAGLGLQHYEASRTEGDLAAVAGLAQVRRQLTRGSMANAN